MRVDSIESQAATELVLDWAVNAETCQSIRMVCAAKVQMVNESWGDPPFRALINFVGLVMPDGQPNGWDPPTARPSATPPRERKR